MIHKARKIIFGTIGIIMLLGGGLLVIGLLQEELVSAAGDITYGTAQEFTNAVQTANQVIELDTNKFVICWNGGENSPAGSCKAATVSGTTITYGTVADFDSDTSVTNSLLGVCKLDTDKFAVAFADDGESDDGFTLVGSVSGTTITFDTGNRVEFSTTDVEWVDCGQLGTDKYVIAYNDETNGDDGAAVVCTVSGTTPSCGSSSEFVQTTQSRNNKVSKLDTDKFAILFEDGILGGDARLVVNTVSGTTLQSWGTILTVENINMNYWDVSAIEQLDTDKVVIVYADGTNNIGKSAICTASGTTISCGDLVNFGTGGDEVEGLGITKIDSTHFVITGEDKGDSEKGKSWYSSFSGDTITQGDAEYFSDVQMRDTTTDLISAGKIVVCYQDDADVSNHGECIIGDISEEGSGGGTPPTNNSAPIMFQ